MPNAEEIERIRLLLVDHQLDIRRKGLAEALALDERGRYTLMHACDITGQLALSDEIVELLAHSWREWPMLTSLCLRQCWMLTAKGCSVLAQQGRFTHLELDGCSLLDDVAIQELAKLPLEALEIWDAKKTSAASAEIISKMLTLKKLKWQNAPNDPAYLIALARSRSITSLAYTCKESRSNLFQPLSTMTELRELEVFSIDDESMFVICQLSHIEVLRIENSNISDGALATLRGLPLLRSLTIGGAKISSEGLAAIGSLKNLEEITLYMNDGGIVLNDNLAVIFGSLPKLRRLKFQSRCDLSDEDVKHICRSGKLEELHLVGCTRITDSGLVHIARMSNMNSLDLSKTSITAQGLCQLSGLVSLTSLSLAETAITAHGLSFLKPLTGLRTLNLRGCRRLVPMDVEPLLGMPNLSELNLDEAGALDAYQTKRLSEYCRKLVVLHCSLSESNAFAPLAMISGLRALWIQAAPHLNNDELALLDRLRELHSFALVDAQWITDSGLDVFTRIPHLRHLGLAGCPGITSAAVISLARKLHLELLGRFGRRVLGRGHITILSGQFLTDVIFSILPNLNHWSLPEPLLAEAERLLTSTDEKDSRRAESILRQAIPQITPRDPRGIAGAH